MQLALALLAAQTSIGCVAALLFYILAGPQSALAALIGAAAAVLPGFYFARTLFKPRPGAGPGRYAWALALGEAGKWALTVGVFIAAAVWLPNQFLPVIATFTVCLLVYWVALLVM